jgi:hypothetical protein
VENSRIEREKARLSRGVIGMAIRSLPLAGIAEGDEPLGIIPRCIQNT